MHTILREGTSADRQLAVYKQTGRHGVVQHLIEETEARHGQGGSIEMKIGLMCGREYSFPPAFIERVNQLGEPHGITAEMSSLGGTRMDEPSEYRVIVDRISHEVEYYRGALKNAVLHGTYVINNPVLVDGRRQVLQLLRDGEARVRDPEDRAAAAEGLPGRRRPPPESLRNLEYPIDWDGLLDYVGRPAILKPYSGGGWKHVYKVHDRQELLAAYDDRAVLHDAAGVHRLRPVRALLHLRQDRHHAGGLRRRRSAATSSSTSTCRRSSARASSATRRRSTRRSATR